MSRSTEDQMVPLVAAFHREVLRVRGDVSREMFQEWVRDPEVFGEILPFGPGHLQRLVRGLTNEEVKRLSEGDILAQVRDVLLGRAEIRAIEHLIDLDAIPLIPDGWSIHSDDQIGSRMRGLLKWDSSKIALYRSRKQRGKGFIKGTDLKRELEGKPVLPANILDYLLKNPHLIHEELKEKTDGVTTFIFFWGTIYRISDGGLYVRYLYWCGGRWSWSYCWLARGWFVNFPAAVAACK